MKFHMICVKTIQLKTKKIYDYERTTVEMYKIMCIFIHFNQYDSVHHKIIDNSALSVEIERT